MTKKQLRNLIKEEIKKLNEWGGKSDLYKIYDNNNDLGADLISYFEKLEDDIHKKYADEMRQNIINSLKKMKLHQGR